MNNIWFTSDAHFGHDRLRLLTPKTRPFSSVEEMDETIINNWNSCVKPEDTIYHLGDFAWKNQKQYLPRLQGNIVFIKGNHDNKLCEIIKHIPSLLEITINQQLIILCHYPMKSWNRSHHGSWMLHGHEHGGIPDDEETLSTDVGMDRWNCMPVSFEQLQELFSKRSNKLLKAHHRKDSNV